MALDLTQQKEGGTIFLQLNYVRLLLFFTI